MLAYSSIAQAGYLVVAIVAASSPEFRLTGLLLYLAGKTDAASAARMADVLAADLRDYASAMRATSSLDAMRALCHKQRDDMAAVADHMGATAEMMRGMV